MSNGKCNNAHKNTRFYYCMKLYQLIIKQRSNKHITLQVCTYASKFSYYPDHYYPNTATHTHWLMEFCKIKRRLYLFKTLISCARSLQFSFAQSENNLDQRRGEESVRGKKTLKVVYLSFNFELPSLNFNHTGDKVSAYSQSWSYGNAESLPQQTSGNANKIVFLPTVSARVNLLYPPVLLCNLDIGGDGWPWHSAQWGQRLPGSGQRIQAPSKPTCG
jgi:hypothetical protein